MAASATLIRPVNTAPIAESAPALQTGTRLRGPPARMRRPIIGFDFDDTIVDLKSAILALLKEDHGIVATLQDMKNPRAQDNLKGITTEDVKKLIRKAWDSAELPKLTEPEVPVVMQNLHEDFRIAITTATEAHKDTVIKLLNQNNIPFDRIILVDSSRDKVRIRGVNVFVDDYPPIALEAAKFGKFTVLYERPWNLELTSAINANGGHERIKPAPTFMHVSSILYQHFG